MNALNFQSAFNALTLLVCCQEEHPAIKNWVMRCRCGYISGARCAWFAYGSADTTATQSSLASVKSRMVLPFWCQLSQAVLEKRLLNGYSSTHTQPFYSSVDFVRDNPGEPVPEETSTHYSSWSSIIPICFLHLLWSMASSLFNPRALQSFSIISLQVFFGLPLGLAPSTSYSIHFFTQSLSSFRNTCPYHHNLFRCSMRLNSVLFYCVFRQWV